MKINQTTNEQFESHGFLPADYTMPANVSSYLKIADGEEFKLRILGTPIIGYIYFNTENKPVRSRTAFDRLPSDIGKNKLDPTKQAEVKHFWAMPIYNITSGDIQIWEITQKTIMTKITDLVKDADWGSPLGYDIKIKREKTNIVSYTITPSNKSAISDEITTAFIARPVNLNALFDGADPFAI